MSAPFSVVFPLLNPNEPEALLAALLVQEGQRVTKGDILCTLETTKSSLDLPAEAEGFVAGLRFAQGDTVRAGEILCYISSDPEWHPAPEERLSNAGEAASLAPAGLRITQPALALATSLGLALEGLPRDRLVTEAVLRSILGGQPSQAEDSAGQNAFDPTAILVYGGGGHGKSLIELLRAVGGYRLAGILDDGLPKGEAILGVPVLGGGGELPTLYDQGVRLAANAVGGIGDVAVRIKVFRLLSQAGFTCPTLVHPAAFVEASAQLSAGVQVFPHAYVGSDARVGFGCIVNTGAIVSHDCQVGDFANLAPGAILAGGVQVGSGVLVGMGVTVNLQVKVGAGARLGNGATVKEDVPPNAVVRAGSVWPA